MKPENGNQNISLENVEHRKGADYCMVAQASVYAESCNLFVPYYRQMNMETYSLPKEQLKEAAHIAYGDVKAAFEYFLANLNNDRPFIIAGHSQGSIMTSMLLADVMKDKTLQRRMVAAYALGWPITQDYMDSKLILIIKEADIFKKRLSIFNSAAASSKGMRSVLPYMIWPVLP